MCQFRIVCLPAFFIFLCASVHAASDAQPHLKLLGSSSYRPGIPVLLRLEVLAADGSVARDLWDAQATLTAAAGASPVTLNPTGITLRNGLGSALVTITSVPAG